MGDLEDAFFKQNVPGQYSKWSCNNDGYASSSDDNSENDEFYFADAPSLPLSTATAAPSAAALKKRGNTGVKGVISDYLDTKRDEQLNHATNRLEELEILNTMINPTKREIPAENKTRRQNDDDNDSDDDEVLQQFRSQRLNQLKNARPIYGTYTTVSPDEYVTLVDTIDTQTFVVVHLYDSSVKESVMLHSALEKVSQMMDHVKFIEVEAYEANPDLDLICLPVILTYKGGELMYNAVRFTDELIHHSGGGDVLDADDVRGKLKELGVDSE